MKGKAEKNEKKQGPAPAKEQSLSNENAAVFQDQRPSLAVQRKLRGGMGDPPQQRGTAQLRSAMQSTSGASSFPIQRKANRTGLPNNLKSGIENLSGFAMDDVKVHYNSSKPEAGPASSPCLCPGQQHPPGPRPGEAPRPRGLARGPAETRQGQADPPAEKQGRHQR